MTVSRAIEESPQHEHVQSPLEKSDPLLCLFFHRRHSTFNLAMMVDTRLSIVKGAAECGFSIDDFILNLHFQSSAVLNVGLILGDSARVGICRRKAKADPHSVHLAA